MSTDIGHAAVSMKPAVCVAWRHPKPIGAQGRCIGRTDLSVDRRKAKRLAHRIRQAARRHGWPHAIHTSPLQRCAAVGRQLRRWGWRHHIDAGLMEMDFGAWDGRAWQHIAQAEVDAWCADFLHGRPGGDGESLRRMFERVASGLDTIDGANKAVDTFRPGHIGERTALPRLVVAHSGWTQVLGWLCNGGPLPTDPAQWSARPPAYGERRQFDLMAARASAHRWLNSN